MTHDLIGNSGKLRNDNHSHSQSGTAPSLSPITTMAYQQCGNWGHSGRRAMLHRNIMHHVGELLHCGSTKVVRSKTRHIARSASSQGVGIGNLTNCAMSLCGRERAFAL
jgi:hypothetical protein